MLFANVDQLLAANAPMLQSLAARQEQFKFRDVPSIGDAFLGAIQRIDQQAYAKYCSNQVRALTLYDQLCKSKPAFAQVMKDCENHPQAERLTLKDYIAKPLQRLTKYPLLLKVGNVGVSNLWT